jgi:hypothetical protein
LANKTKLVSIESELKQDMPRSKEEMLSDFFREASVLVLVFGFLDNGKWPSPGWLNPHIFKIFCGLFIALVSWVLFYWGTKKEYERGKRR